MVYITGDTHSDFRRFRRFCAEKETTVDDIAVVLGDAGLNYFGDDRDDCDKDKAAAYPITFLCIHGNHERRPETMEKYAVKRFCGGEVWYEEKYPNLLFAKDGEIYRLGECDCLVIGGAYSIDKYIRLMRGWNWFEDEQPSDETKARVESVLAARGNKIDVVLSHTCPKKYEPTEVFLDGFDQSRVDKTTEEWLDAIEERIEYKRWYCGHFHTIKEIDKLRFMFGDIDVLKEAL